MRAVSPLHDPETRKELSDDLAWLWEEVRMALVALGKAREAMEVLAVHLGCRGPREEEDPGLTRPPPAPVTEGSNPGSAYLR
jgi:hypothetical protein